jgi:DNA (cytosine-5)-methyltransferase 1
VSAVKIMSKLKKLIAISLFSGAGGMDIGIKQAGFDVLACVELDHNCCDTLRCAIEAEKTHTRIYEEDIRNLDPHKLMADIGCNDIDLLFGGPPCQSFSSIGKQKSLKDERGMLLFQITRFVEAIQPKVVLMEQVKGVLSAKDCDGKRGGVLEKLLLEFSRLGYVAKYKVCLAADYGVPQLRERVFLVATKDKNGFVFPEPTHCAPKNANGLFALPTYATVGDVLVDLPPPHLKTPGTMVFGDEYRNHVDVTPKRDRERMHFVPEGSYLAAQTHLPPELRKGLIAKDTTKFLRLNRSRPSNTLRCGEIFYHPTDDRYLTPREYMRIHGYPDSYLLKGPIRSRTGTVKSLDQHRQIANSVPPPLAKIMAEQIKNYIYEEIS